MRGPLRKGMSGLGRGVLSRKPQSWQKAEREAILRIFEEIEEQKRLVDVMSNLKHFGEWVKMGECNASGRRVE